MTWVFVSVGSGVAGLAILAALAVRVFAAARALGREVERARVLLEPRHARLRAKIDAVRPSGG
ncbi:hypothetical protein J5X84_40285 [Streptosporangiaceae bacterium NEAU-GS5]|nr:hypothetical protein [Streptosporangiaceae bacterium NEAU-GS5]